MFTHVLVLLAGGLVTLLLAAGVLAPFVFFGVVFVEWHKESRRRGDARKLSGQESEQGHWLQNTAAGPAPSPSTTTCPG